MLKITLGGDAFDLPPDVAINMVYENPMLVTDRIPTAHTVSSTLPPSKRNLEILGHPNRIHRKTKIREYPGARIYHGPVLILRGVFVLTEYDQEIKYFIRGAIFTDEMQGPVSSADLDDYNFGDEGSRFTPQFYLADDIGYNYREYIHSTLPGNSDTVAAPIRILGVEWPNNPTVPDSFGWYTTSIMYFNYFNSDRGEFMMALPSSQLHTVCLPLINLAYLVDEIFDSSLVANPFTGDLAKLFLTSTYHPKFSDVIFSAYKGVLLDTTELDVDQLLKLESLATSMNFNVLIKQAVKLFGMALFIKADEFEFKFLKDILSSSEKEDWSDLLIGELAHWVEDGESYAYGYSGFAGKEKPGGVSEFDHISELAAQTVVDGEEKNIYINDTQQLFALRKRFDDSTGVEAEYEYVTEVVDPGFGAAPGTPTSGFNMISEITPLAINLHPYWWENIAEPILFGRWYVPEWEGDRFVPVDTPNILIYHGMQDTLTDLEDTPGTKAEYPYLSSHNYDTEGNRLSDLSLHWEGADGLRINYHEEMIEWVESDKVKARGSILLSALHLKNLDMSERKHIKGMDFFIEKLEVTLLGKKIEPARVHLVQAPDILVGSGSSGGGL